MFKKPKRNFRARRTNLDDSDDESSKDSVENSNQNVNSHDSNHVEVDPAHDPNIMHMAVKRKKKEKEKEKKMTGTLSFGGDEEDEGETFKLKKSSSSRRLAKQMKRESLRECAEQEKRQVDKERLETNEKKRRAEQAKQTAVPKKPMVMGETNGNGRAPANIDIDRPGRSDEESSDDERAGRSSFQSCLNSGVIPDANMIHMARKKRQQAREMGDYVPLDQEQEAQSVPEKSVSNKTGSRLIREEDHDLSDDDGERLTLKGMGEARDRHLRDIQTTILAAQEGNDESDQEAEWEEQQLKKGVNMPQVQLPPTAAMAATHDGNYQQYLYSQSSNIFTPAGAAYSYNSQQMTAPPVGLLASKPIDEITISSLKKILQERHDSMESVHRAHVQEQKDNADRVLTCKTTIEKCMKKKPTLEKQSKFFQETHGYLRDLVDCLNEKVPQIELLERLCIGNWKQRSQRFTARRQEDIKDQAADFSSAKVQTLVPPPEQEKQRRVAEREARRARRRRFRESRSILNHNEGMSTDDEESKSEETRFNVEKDRVQNDCRSIFGDVVDDFHDISSILTRFEAWKLEERESYEEAYIGLCLPKLFTPFIKLSLIDWNPLQGGQCSSNFEEKAWFEGLLFYGSLERDDPDTKLLPNLVEKVVLPKLTGLVELVYDPLSQQQTLGLSQVIKKLIKEYPSVNADSKNTTALLKALALRLRRTLDDDVFMPLYPKPMLENKASGQSMFHQRQFWTCVKLLNNMCKWHTVLSDKLLRELSIDCLLNRYIVFALVNSPANTETVHKCEVIVSTLPSVWFSSLGTEKTLPQMENFCRVLLSAAKSTHAASLDKTDIEKKQARSRLKQIGRMLLQINAKNHYNEVSEQYSFSTKL